MPCARRRKRRFASDHIAFTASTFGAIGPSLLVSFELTRIQP